MKTSKPKTAGFLKEFFKPTKFKILLFIVIFALEIVASFYIQVPSDCVTPYSDDPDIVHTLIACQPEMGLIYEIDNSDFRSQIVLAIIIINYFLAAVIAQYGRKLSLFRFVASK